MTDYFNVPVVATGDWIDAAWLNQYLGDNFRAIFQGLANAGSIPYAIDANTVGELGKPSVNSLVKNTSAGVPSYVAESKFMLPVGAVFISVVSTNPATLLGYGTWVAFGAGRVPVGFDATQTEFDTVEETGGEKTHTLIPNEMPAHTHSLAVSTAPDAGGNVGNRTWPSGSTATSSAGGGAPHNNLQPYIVVYMWKRTA